MSLDPLYSAVSWVLLRWHSVLVTPGLDPAGGTGWTLSIVLLVVTARVLLVPVFLSQLRRQRALTALRPHLVALRRRLAHDPAELQRRTLALHTEHGVSPFAGFAPALLQIPVFVGLVHVLRHLAKAASPTYQAAFPHHLELYGFTAAQTASAGRAASPGRRSPRPSAARRATCTTSSAAAWRRRAGCSSVCSSWPPWRPWRASCWRAARPETPTGTSVPSRGCSAASSWWCRS